jgi:hypothetical protein
MGPPAKLVFGLYRWPDDRDGAYYSLRYNNGSVMGNLATVRFEIWKIIDAESRTATGAVYIGPETEQLTLKVNRDGDPTVEIDDEPEADDDEDRPGYTGQTDLAGAGTIQYSETFGVNDYGIPGFAKMTPRQRIDAIKANMSPEELAEFDRTAAAVDHGDRTTAGRSYGTVHAPVTQIVRRMQAFTTFTNCNRQAGGGRRTGSGGDARS